MADVLIDIICMQITPSVDSAMFFFGTNVLHFSEEFYGTVLLIDGIAQVIGALRVLRSDAFSATCLPMPRPTPWLMCIVCVLVCTAGP